MSESPLQSIRYDAHGVPHPPECLTRRERFALLWAGLRDRTHYRRMDPTDHTELTLRLVTQCQAGVTAVHQWQTRRHLELTQELRGLQATLQAQPPTRLQQRLRSELATLDAGGRVSWAQDNRRAAAVAAQASRLAAAQGEATVRLAHIESELAHLPRIAEEARGRWAADLHERIMIYARFRSSRIAPAQLIEALAPASLVIPAPNYA